MQIQDIKAMRGPNYWSNYRQKLIVMKLDLKEFEELPTDKLGDFNCRLVNLIPSLHEHRCSKGEIGGFIERLDEGTWLGHVVEHVALELQTLAGMECGFGRTRSTGKKGVYHVVFSYLVENAGIYAAKAAVRLVLELVKNKACNLDADIQSLSKIYESEKFGISTQAILDEARKRDIPYTRLDNGSMVMLGQGANQKHIIATVSSQTGSIGVDIAADKNETRRVLSEAYIPVPKGTIVRTIHELKAEIQNIGFPIVIKPYNGNHGRGVTTGIDTEEKAIVAYEFASHISKEVIVEKHISGDDFRLLVINNKFVAAAKRSPACIMGNGKSTILELVEKTNMDPKRGDDHQNVLTKIIIDQQTMSILSEKSKTLDTVLPLNEKLYLKHVANLSSGGTAIDVTEQIHSLNIFMAERISRLLNLDICGIDLVAHHINRPLNQTGGAVIEVNAGPGFRMHLSPTSGKSRNVASAVIDMLFPIDKPSRIPIVAVTGTNGKTTVSRLIAHITKAAGLSPGYTTTDGIYINDTEICRGDCSGPNSAAVILRDPIVNFAVLECARGGILRSGLGFDKCNIGIVTNVSSDHLGLNDIETIEQLADVKSVVPRSVMQEGYAILNADDDLVFDMKNNLDCKVALFALDGNSPRIKEHCMNDGLACFAEDGQIFISKGMKKIRIACIRDIPMTLQGRSECMIENLMPAVLTGIIQKFSIETICYALKTFKLSGEHTPGRMNEFSFPNCTLLIDYAHNEGAYIALKKYMDNVTSVHKVGIVGATGDRRDDDIRKVGYYAAQMFDEIIIRHDKDCRGRTKDELTELVYDGVRYVNPHAVVSVISDEYDALRYAFENTPEGSYIVHCGDEIYGVLEYVKTLRARKTENTYIHLPQPSKIAS